MYLINFALLYYKSVINSFFPTLNNYFSPVDKFGFIHSRLVSIFKFIRKLIYKKVY